ncbi:MAG TPA: LptF/LptG family permease [Pirellulales bacterium]|jgi:lipopolysaccharide export system permease protein|nr:LptF/LptG family permease [Pirellulales bacterium]
MSNVPSHAVQTGLLRLLIIDRYLLRQFWHSFVICFCSLTGLYIVIDGFGNLEEFINYAQKHGSLLAIMGEYYGYRSLSFFDTASHLLTLIAAMFTVTWIQRHNELTALEAAGIPKSRIIQPMVGAAIVIIVLSIANREIVIPAVRPHLSHNAQDLEGSEAKPLQARYDNETVVLLGGPGSKTFADQRRIHKPDFYLPAGLDRYGPRLLAEDAFYQPPRQSLPGGYRFVGIDQPKGLDQQPSLLLRDRPVLLTPRDTPWLKPGECFVASNVSFEHLESGTEWRQYASTLELIRGLRNRSLDYGADDRLVIHARVVKPLLDITLLFLGLPLMLSRSNRNVFLAIGMCLGLVIAFMLVVMGCKYLGTSYWIEPALAAWLPLMIFVPCAVALSQPLRE